MKSWTRLWLLAVISIWIPIFLVIRYSSFLAYVLLVLWVAIFLGIIITFIHRQNEKEKRLIIQSVEQTAIKSLNHHRHDWMNDLQIMYGYIQLKKYDKSIECVGRIKERMELEGKIAKLGIPSLVFYLQSFRTIGSNVELEVHVADDLHLNGRIMGNDAEDWVSAIVECIRIYQYKGKISWEECRKLTLSLYEENGEIVALFECDHVISNYGDLEQEIHNVVRRNRIRMEQLKSSAFSFQLRVLCDR
ncbi:Spo0B domain-containing protein [Paenibacillus crassostreae]|uniref:SpoOB alpha-helical domain-containing protein n=1 Tax=Paenibacillus crassostreae TaxID=1763538 RepID=A0A167EEW0_9BACL|nr:Spo0B domain-containing protein [Paenibacillus crassostreae]AOZ91899.1 hypothetical protein LPB68_06490 [Paenibacillus crassostreae]OAB75470.1 hypothetical protein PNBC_08905 [Paenibacillus crassostreae]